MYEIQCANSQRKGFRTGNIRWCRINLEHAKGVLSSIFIIFFSMKGERDGMAWYEYQLIYVDRKSQ